MARRLRRRVKRKGSRGGDKTERERQRERKAMHLAGDARKREVFPTFIHGPAWRVPCSCCLSQSPIPSHPFHILLWLLAFLFVLSRDRGSVQRVDLLPGNVHKDNEKGKERDNSREEEQRRKKAFGSGGFVFKAHFVVISVRCTPTQHARPSGIQAGSTCVSSSQYSSLATLLCCLS